MSPPRPSWVQIGPAGHNRVHIVRQELRSPISIIPDDVLHEIFYLVAEDGFICTERWMTLYGRTRCLNLSHVCRYWRRLTLGSPQLWTFIALTRRISTYHLNLYLERSENAPLHLMLVGDRSVMDTTDDWSHKARILSDHLNRFQEFLVLEFQPQEIMTILGFFDKPAPKLQTLKLDADRQLLYPSLFAREMPSLREVRVKGVSMTWLPYKDLTALVLCDQLVPSLDRLLWTLRNCPKLKALKLGLLGAMNDEGATDLGSRGNTLVLPQLEELVLRSHVCKDVMDILSHLSFPSTASVGLVFQGPNRNTNNIAQQCPSLNDIITMVRHLTLEVVSSYSWSTRFVLWSPDANLRLEWEWFEEGRQNDMLEYVGFSLVSFPALQHLTISADSSRFTEQRWLQILSSVPTIVSMDLDIKDSFVLAFFAALSQKPVIPYPPSPEALVCPNLKRLVISRMDEQDSIFYEMATRLRTRDQYGCRLESLDLAMRSSRTLPPEIYSLLQKSIAQVTIKYGSYPAVPPGLRGENWWK